MAIAFYCLGTLDVTGIAERQISPTSRKSWKEWIWDQYAGKEHLVFFLFLLCSFFAHLVLWMCHNRRRVSPWSVCERERW
jgi:hypothetical protein